MGFIDQNRSLKETFLNIKREFHDGFVNSIDQRPKNNWCLCENLFQDESYSKHFPNAKNMAGDECKKVC